MLEEIREFLQNLEAHLVENYDNVRGEAGEEESFRFCMLKLAVKCLSLLQITSILLSKDYMAEAKAISRIFQETFTYLQHFILYEGKNSKFEKWKQKPEKPLKERDEKLREQIDNYWNAKFKDAVTENLWRKQFKFLSNSFVHPTFQCIKLSYIDAVWRHIEKLTSSENKRIDLEKSWKKLSDLETRTFCSQTLFYLMFFVDHVWKILELDKYGYEEEKLLNFITKLNNYIETEVKNSAADSFLEK